MSIAIAAKAGAWSALDIALRQGVGFAVSIVLARLLTPADFGLIAILSLFSSLSLALVQGGLSLALIRRQDTSLEEESAVFWCNLIAGFLFAAIMIPIGPALASFYDYPALAELMLIPAAQVIISGFGAVHLAILTRELRFDLLAIVGVLASILSGLGGISAALMGWGVWALGVQLLLAALINSLGIWFVSDWRPALRFRIVAITDLYRFGLGISASTTLEVLYSQGFALVIGKLHGASDLGLFNRAASTQALPGNIFLGIMSRVALPLFSARKDDRDALRRGLRMSLGLAMLFSLPVIAGLALLSDLILLCLFGSQWVPAARILTILSLAGALLPLHVLNLQLLLALGRSNEFLKIEIKKKVLGIGFVLVGSFYGIEGLAYAMAFVSVPTLLLNAAPTKRLLGYGAAAQLYDSRGVIAATVFMGLVVLGAKSMTSFDPLMELLLLVAIGAVSYLSFGFGLRLSTFNEAIETVRPLLSRPPPR